MQPFAAHRTGYGKKRFVIEKADPEGMGSGPDYQGQMKKNDSPKEQHPVHP